MKRRFISIFLIVMLMVTLISGCGTGENTNDNNSSTSNDSGDSSGNMDTGGEDSNLETPDTLKIGLTADPASFSPLDSTMMIELRLYENFYDTLIEVDLNGKLQPALAESWTISEDGLTYSFDIRKGVKFHNGDELKASDVVYTFNKLYRESANYYDLSQLYKNASALDEYTVEVQLAQPSAMFMAEIASMGYIFNEKYHQEVGDGMSSSPMGTGAYTLASRELGSKIVFERFDDYFKGAAPIKTVIYRILPDANTLVVALESEDIDYTDAIPLASKSILVANNKIDLQVLSGIRLDWVAMNVENDPFDNVKVRQAVNYALNREFLNDVVYEGEGKPWDAMLLPNMIAAPDSYPKYSYDIEKAKELMKEAGFPDGFKVEKPILCTTASAKTAEVLQASLIDIGIITEIQTTEFGAYIDRYRKGDFSLALGGYFFITPDTNLPATMYKSELIGIMNNARYVNPEVDELLQKALKESDEDKRREMYNEVYTIVQKDAPYAVAIIPPAVIAYDADLVVDNANSRNIRLYNFSWK